MFCRGIPCGCPEHIESGTHKGHPYYLIHNRMIQLEQKKSELISQLGLYK